MRDNLGHDLPAGLVVFLVAVPLCLGIAFASGAPLVAGLITGIVGGLIVAPVSKASLAVTGPAAGLFVIVHDAITDLGSYEAFLTAVCLAGLIQIAAGFAKAGIVAHYVPSSVIKGMLAGIGVVLILKQVPHALGVHGDFEGDVFFRQPDGRSTFTELGSVLGHVHLGSMTVAVVGLAILVVWSRVPALRRLRFLPGPLVAVLLGIGINMILRAYAPALAMEGELLVGIPELNGLAELRAELRSPDLSALSDPGVYRSAVVLAIVASIETLLCIGAIDKLDPFKRDTPTSHELKAQGLGNLVAGVLGGLPMTAVIVRGSANVQAGGRTWMAAFFQGILLLLALVAVPRLLNQIPLAALAAILIHTGYKLVTPALVKKMVSEGVSQWLPFGVTVIGIVLTDLLTGVLIGFAVGLFFVLRAHMSAPYELHELSARRDDGTQHIRIVLGENVSFLNKASLESMLQSFDAGSTIEIDARKNRYIDHDALEAIDELLETAQSRELAVTAQGLEDLRERPGQPRAAT